MALCMGYREAHELDSRSDGEWELVGRRMSLGGSRPREATAAAATREHLGRRGQRSRRFESVTVRAAARVLELQRCGVVSATEARFFLRELVSMDAHAARGASPSLLRAARRYARQAETRRTRIR